MALQKKKKKRRRRRNPSRRKLHLVGWLVGWLVLINSLRSACLLRLSLLVVLMTNICRNAIFNDFCKVDLEIQYFDILVF